MRRNHIAFALAGMLISLTACGGETTPTGPGVKKVLHPEAEPLPGEEECTVVETTDLPIEGEAHQPTCTDMTYKTNPPSSGDHWPVWAAFRKYDKPVPRGMYVHNLEHGTVVLLYKCSGSCPDVVAMLDSVRTSTSDSCDAPRILLTPDPELATPIAASAWGATYTATCIDKASLAAFAKAHIGQGPEDVCTGGADVSNAAPCP